MNEFIALSHPHPAFLHTSPSNTKALCDTVLFDVRLNVDVSIADLPTRGAVPANLSPPP